jgi:mono/diheme cytochrome c family protein
MFRVIAVALLVLALGLGAVACGEDEDNGTDTTTTETTTDETNGETTAAGRTIFVDNCGTCHTLADAGTSGTIGPVLDGTSLSENAIETQVRNGGGAMPAFEGDLSDDEIEDVAAYVAAES